MDFLSIGGIVLALGAIIGSMTLDGGNLMSLLQLSALVIVGGGTLAATLLQTPLPNEAPEARRTTDSCDAPHPHAARSASAI